MYKRGFLLVTSLLVLLLAGAPDSTASAPVKAVPQKGKFAAGITRLRSKFPSKKVDALCAYLEAMCSVPGGSMDGKTVEAFSLGATPVTWEVWEEYQAIYGGKTDKPRFASAKHPVVNVSAEDCDQFCVWLTNVTGIKFSLPSSVEFEYAGREGGKVREYPWGDGFDNTKLWGSVVQKRAGTAAVDRTVTIFTNGLGLSDMSGNVWQWCSDSDGTNRYLKGGSWYSFVADIFRCAFQFGGTPVRRFDGDGFRLASRER